MAAPITPQHIQQREKEGTMTQDEANILLTQAEAKKAEAHARLMNAQAEQLENENAAKPSAE